MSDLVVDGNSIRTDGDMWCLTDLWRAAGGPKEKRPANWLRKDGASFVEFLGDSLNVPRGHNSICRAKRGVTGDTWAHWQIALAYAKALSHAFHARVNEVYRAFTAGQLVPLPSAEHNELVRLSLRIKALGSADYESVWDLELKLELARLRRIDWTGNGAEPKGLAFAYGRTWRIILGDRVYEELKRRNPYPRDGALHGQWLTAERTRVTRREDLVIALVLARRSSRWSEYEQEMRSHFRRTPIQLRLVASRDMRLPAGPVTADAKRS